MSEILGPWAMVVGLLASKWTACDAWGRMGRRQAKIAGRFDAGHGRLAAQLGAGINCIILQHLLSKGGNHI